MKMMNTDKIKQLKAIADQVNVDLELIGPDKDGDFCLRPVLKNYFGVRQPSMQPDPVEYNMSLQQVEKALADKLRFVAIGKDGNPLAFGSAVPEWIAQQLTYRPEGILPVRIETVTSDTLPADGNFQMFD